MSRRASATDIKIGERIRAARELKKVSQEELAEAIGISFQQVQKYEGGTNRVSCGRLVEIAAAVELPVLWFFEGVHSNDKLKEVIERQRQEIEGLKAELAYISKYSQSVVRGYK